ncbi:hypothetical protein, partial [Escherichia coli]|uniref:hypothetical protein n=1 Tax=Escherichia coli TaxID=562 RepID=UPI0021C5E40E
IFENFNPGESRPQNFSVSLPFEKKQGKTIWEKFKEKKKKEKPPFFFAGRAHPNVGGFFGPPAKKTPPPALFGGGFPEVWSLP